MMEEKEIQKRIDVYELKTVAQLKDMLRELNVQFWNKTRID